MIDTGRWFNSLVGAPEQDDDPVKKALSYLDPNPEADAPPSASGLAAAGVPPASGSLSTYNDPTDQGTIRTPLPPQQPSYADPTISDPSYTGGGVSPIGSGTPGADGSDTMPQTAQPAPDYNFIPQDGRSVPPTPQGFEPWQTERTPPPNIQMADGRVEPPTSNGDYQPMRTIPNPNRPADPGQWLAEDSQSTPPEPYSPYGAPRDAVAAIDGSTPPDMGDGGRARQDAQVDRERRGIGNYQPVASTPGEPDYVAPRYRPLEVADVPRVAGQAVSAARDAAQAEWQNITNPQPGMVSQATGIHPVALSIASRLVGPSVMMPGSQEVANVVMAAITQFGDSVGRRVAQALGVPDGEFVRIKAGTVPGVKSDIVLTNEDVAGLVGSTLLDPTNLVGAGEAKPAARAAASAGREIAAATPEVAREVAQGAGRVGYALAEEGAHQLMDLTPSPRMMGAAESGGGRAARAVEDVPAPHVYSPTPPEGVNRRYHGTASEFDAADPGKFDENGLYGPGYYTTSDPRVASDYSTTRAVDMQRRARLEDELAQFQLFVVDPNSTPRQKELAQKNIPQLRQMLDDMPSIESGPNVRPVDVPSNLNMIDADAPLTQDTLDRINGVIAQVKQKHVYAGEELEEAMGELAADMARRGPDAPPLSNDAMLQHLMAAAERAGTYTNLGYGKKGISTAILERAGFDGIAHQGGKRVPMLDGAGNPIEHDVSVIFPGKVDKVTNAFSGTKGGLFVPAGAAAGTETDEDGNPVGVDPLKAAGGMAVAGILGSGSLKRVGARWRQATTRAAAQATAARAAGKAPPATAADWLRSIGYSGMIGPSTGAVNTIGNGLELLYAVPKEVTRALVRRKPREALQEGKGLVAGLMHAGGEMLDALAGAHPGGGVESAGLSQRVQNPVGQILANLIESPTRVFSEAPDALFRSIATGMGEHRTAAQIASREGLSGSAWSKRVAELLDDLKTQKAGGSPLFPSQVAEIEKGADELAQRLTLRGDVGPRGKAFKAGVDALPVGLGNIIMPFFNTPYQMMQRQLERSPVGLGMKTQPAKFDKYYDAAVGTGIGFGVAGLAVGGMVTGSGPDDPEKKAMLRAQGWQPNSTLIKGVWVPNNVFGVFGPMLDSAGEIGDAVRFGKGDMMDRERWTDLMKRGAKVAGNQVYLRGISDLVKVMDDPGSGFENYAANLGSRLIPGGATARLAGNATDPNERAVDRAKDVGSGEAIRQRIARGLPGQGLPLVGGREGLDVAQDVLGRPQANERQGLAAFGPKLRTPQAEPVIQAFQDNNVDIGFPPSTVTVDGVDVPLTPQQQRKWQQFRGEYLLKEVPKTTKSQFWNRPTTTIGDRADELRDLAKEANEDASDRMQDVIGPRQLNTLIREAERKKAQERGERVPAGR